MNHVDKGKASTRFVVIGLLLGIFMAAMDNTIVATAMGSIVADLGNFDKFAWVTASYMVAVMAGMPIYGKLSDMYGRKRFFCLDLFSFNWISAVRYRTNDGSAHYLPSHSRAWGRCTSSDRIYDYLRHLPA